MLSLKPTKLAVLITLAKVIDKYSKMYCTISQAKILELLDRIHKISIKRRDLNYHLRTLRELGLIISIRRNHRNPDGTLCLRTSATYLTADGWEQLARLGWTRAVIYWKRIAAKYKDYQEQYQTRHKVETEDPVTDHKSAKRWIEKLKATVGLDEERRAHERVREMIAAWNAAH